MTVNSDPPESGRDPRPLSAVRSALGGRRAYLVVLAAIALATAGGMFALWPRGKQSLASSVATAEVKALRHTYSGKIVSETTYEDCCQKIEFELTDGPDAGKREQGENPVGPGLPQYSAGDSVRVGRLYGKAARYQVVDFDRHAPLIWLVIAFAALVVLFGRFRGALSLVGLGLSLLVILLFVAPAILHDSPPLAVALVGSMAVMLTTIPLAHGIGPKGLASMAGIAFSLAVIVALAVLFTRLAHLTGVSSNEEFSLARTYYEINFQSLLIAGMVIGALGVLNDVAVSQASTVFALRKANPRLKFRELLFHAIDVGRDHISATVNTLVLAYAGTSLTTLLLLSSGQFDFADAVNLDGPASVIIAGLVGSIGLICAVPITTAFAALLAENLSAEELAAEADHGHVH